MFASHTSMIHYFSRYFALNRIQNCLYPGWYPEGRRFRRYSAYSPRKPGSLQALTRSVHLRFLQTPPPPPATRSYSLEKLLVSLTLHPRKSIQKIPGFVPPPPPRPLRDFHVLVHPPLPRPPGRPRPGPDVRPPRHPRHPRSPCHPLAGSPRGQSPLRTGPRDPLSPTGRWLQSISPPIPRFGGRLPAPLLPAGVRQPWSQGPV